MNRTIHRTTGITAAAMTLTLGLAACGTEDEMAQDATSNESASESPSESATDPEMGGMDAAADTFGPACSQIPASGAGSLDGMATAPVADAASANPLLKTLVKAVGAAGLGDTLNSAPALTVFAPTDDAFAEIPKKKLKALLKDKKALTTVLSHHVIGEQLGPDEVAGELETLAKDTLTVEGTGEEITVGDEGAQVLCGGIKTANATVYVIDSVLMPQM